MLKTLQTPKQLSEITGLTTDTIVSHIHSGRLKASNLARPGASRPRWYIHPADWQAFLDSCANQVDSTTPAQRRKKPAPGKEYV